MERKYLLCLSGALILASLAIIFILPNLSSAPAGYLEIYDIKKDEKVGGLYCNIYYLEWHGRKTDLEFLFYTRERVAGYSVPASAGGQWIPGGKEDPIPIKDLGVCTAKDGDVFKITISIAYAYARIAYDNKTVIIPDDAGELGVIS